MEYGIRIDLQRQRLVLWRGGVELLDLSISSGKAGIGCEEGSGRTPTGRFRIASKHGENAPLGCVFQARIPRFNTELSSSAHADADHVLTRILTLAGLDEENANTLARYIYIHGTAHEAQLGTPVSHGCIRVAPEEMIALYELSDIGMSVEVFDTALESLRD